MAANLSAVVCPSSSAKNTSEVKIGTWGASVFVELFVLQFFQIKIESREIYWKVSGNRSHLPQNPADPPKTTNTSGRLMVDTRFSKFRKVFGFFLIDSGPNDFC